jgi:hypothetical protein
LGNLVVVRGGLEDSGGVTVDEAEEKANKQTANCTCFLELKNPGPAIRVSMTPLRRCLYYALFAFDLVTSTWK